MRPISAGDSPLARRLGAALAALQPERVRIGRSAYTDAFLSVQPSLVTDSDRRARLGSTLEELMEAGTISMSRTFDYSERPPLPRFVVLLDRTPDPRAPDAAGYPWRPELAWAARLQLRRSEFETLRSIQVFLRDRNMVAPIVPTAERSLELFGDEKRLDALRVNRRLFAPGRLSLPLLRTQAHAPPFAFRRMSGGPIALVLENIATYHSIISTLPPASEVGLVIFGGGTNFAASVAFLSELRGEGTAAPITAICYFGDLDRRGLEIPIAADTTSRNAGLPAVRPAVSLWTELLRIGRRAPHRRIHPTTADRLATWLPEPLRVLARDVLVSGERLAQEAVGTELLARDASWASSVGLGVRDDP